ncbi:hypothetical protein AAU61_11985 [Desulfocarbo indianensis]|nr:hypothetical protein AAU61_11985 [Desulfocarbo indianensis]
MTERPQFPQCRDCLASLAVGSAKAAAGDDAELETRIKWAARRVLAQSLEEGLRSPAIATRMLREVRRLSGVDDPYADFKAREMAHAKQVAQGLSGAFQDDLRGLVSLAALGNSLDFFQDPATALAGPADEGPPEVRFHHDDIARFEEALAQGPKLMLFFSDNAGEIYFDLPLLDRLRLAARRVVLVVKGGPAQNDLTRQDLAREGLLERAGEVADTGLDAAGLEWRSLPPGLRGLIEQADLLVAKGMANYLSTLEQALPCPGFFVFKLKCQPLRDLWDAPPESFWAQWREPGPA